MQKSIIEKVKEKAEKIANGMEESTQRKINSICVNFKI